MSPGAMINHNRTLRVRFFLHHPLSMNYEINKKKSYFFQLNHDGNFENIKKLKGPSILRNKTYIFQFSKKNGRKNL